MRELGAHPGLTPRGLCKPLATLAADAHERDHLYGLAREEEALGPLLLTMSTLSELDRHAAPALQAAPSRDLLRHDAPIAERLGEEHDLGAPGIAPVEDWGEADYGLAASAGEGRTDASEESGMSAGGRRRGRALELFAELDKDGDGEIDVPSFLELLRAVGAEPTNEALASVSDTLGISSLTGWASANAPAAARNQALRPRFVLPLQGCDPAAPALGPGHPASRG